MKKTFIYLSVLACVSGLVFQGELLAKSKKQMDAETRKQVQKMRTLETKGDASSRTELIKNLGDESGTIRMQAAVALGNMKESSAVKPLIDALNSEQESGVRIAIIQALGAIGGQEALAAVKASVEDKNQYVRGTALNTLEQCGARGTAAEWKKMLDGQNADVRVAAAAYLSETGDAGGLSTAMREAENPDPRVRLNAVKTVSRVGKAVPEVKAFLEKAVQDEEPSISGLAKEALSKLKFPDKAAE